MQRPFSKLRREALQKLNTKSKKRLLAMAAVLIGAIFIVILAIIVTRVIITPTENVEIINDTNAEVTVSSCGSNPLTLRPGESEQFDMSSNDIRAACPMYEHSTGRYSGCLLTPTNTPGSGPYRVSDLRTDIKESSCGD